MRREVNPALDPALVCKGGVDRGALHPAARTDYYYPTVTLRPASLRRRRGEQDRGALKGAVNIEYLEKPVTSDEKCIASILARVVQAVETKNIELLLSLLWDDATVTTSSGISRFELGKEEYKENISKILSRVRKIYYGGVLIRVHEHLKEKRADVSCSSYVTTYTSNHPKKVERHFIFTKRGNIWRIAKIEYPVPLS